MKMAQEFKKFIARGNVIDMAVGIIMGAAFTTIVKSLVDDIIMPVIGIFTGKIDFTNKFINLGPGEFETLKAAQEAGAPTVNYGLFLNGVLTFVIVALAVFMLVRMINELKDRAQEEEKEKVKQQPVKEAPKDIQLLTEIRDLLKKK
jgi:large conductance mechanosensitive channel